MQMRKNLYIFKHFAKSKKLVWAERNHPPPQLSITSLALSTYLSILIGWSLTLSYSSKINSYLYHQRTSWYVIRGQCCHSRWVWQPSADSNCCLAQFFLNSNFLGQAWHPLLTIMVCETAITIGRGLSHPTRSLSRIVCRGQEHPKGSKGTLRPDFQARTRTRIFLKSQCHHKIQGDSCKEIQV